MSRHQVPHNVCIMRHRNRNHLCLLQKRSVSCHCLLQSLYFIFLVLLAIRQPFQCNMPRVRYTQNSQFSCQIEQHSCTLILIRLSLTVVVPTLNRIPLLIFFVNLFLMSHLHLLYRFNGLTDGVNKYPRNSSCLKAFPCAHAPSSKVSSIRLSQISVTS